MAFRSHVLRPLDLSLTSNRLAIGMTGLVGLAAVAVWQVEGVVDALWAPIHAFVAWSLVREIDPDHDWTALAGGLVAAVSALVMTPMSTQALIGLVAASRLVLNSTGRRPLGSDLAVLAAIAAVISVTAAGWVGGFGLAVAIYIDERFADEQKTTTLFAAGIGALGASAVATLAGAFPRELPEVRPLLVVVAGVLALIAVIREPEAPISQVDSRRKTFMVPGRLHASRALFGVLVFAVSMVAGIDEAGVAPLAVVLAMVLVSNELERARRRIR